MYRDLTENKPPLGYWLYALAVALGGYNELAIRLMPIPAVADHDRPGLVDWLDGSAGSLAACLAALLYVLLEHRSVPLRQRIEHGTFHESVLGGVAALVIMGWNSDSPWTVPGGGS